MAYLKHALLWACGAFGAAIGWSAGLWLWGRIT